MKGGGVIHEDVWRGGPNRTNLQDINVANSRRISFEVALIWYPSVTPDVMAKIVGLEKYHQFNNK